MAGVKDASLQPKGYQQITALSASTALTIPDGARYALIEAETQAVRYRDDGTAPTAGIGMLLAPASATAYIALWYTGKLSALRFIEVAASAKLNISYYA
jgi:hypothetical protein